MNEQQRNAINRAERARRVVADEMVQEALSVIKAAIREQVFALPMEDTAKRERLVMLDKVREQFEAVFVHALINGEVAQHELMAEEKAKSMFESIKERVRSYVG